MPPSSHSSSSSTEEEEQGDSLSEEEEEEEDEEEGAEIRSAAGDESGSEKGGSSNSRSSSSEHSASSSSEEASGESDVSEEGDEEEEESDELDEEAGEGAEMSLTDHTVSDSGSRDGSHSIALPAAALAEKESGEGEHVDVAEVEGDDRDFDRDQALLGHRTPRRGAPQQTLLGESAAGGGGSLESSSSRTNIPLRRTTVTRAGLSTAAGLGVTAQQTAPREVLVASSSLLLPFRWDQTGTTADETDGAGSQSGDGQPRRKPQFTLDASALAGHVELASAVDVDEIGADLLLRQVDLPWGGSGTMWRRRARLPREVDLLNSQFRTQMKGSLARGAGGTWSCSRFELTPTALKLFNRARLHVPEGRDVRTFSCKFERVDLLLFPLGASLLVFKVNWLPGHRQKTPKPTRLLRRDRHSSSSSSSLSSSSSTSVSSSSSSSSSSSTSPSSSSSEKTIRRSTKRQRRRTQVLSMDDVRALVFVSKYVHRVPGVSEGWTFEMPCRNSSTDTVNTALDSLSGIAAAVFCTCGKHILSDKDIACVKHAKTFAVSAPLSLASIASWLLEVPKAKKKSRKSKHSKGAARRINLDSNRHARHHSTVVLGSRPPDDVLGDFLFHLRRAFGQKNRPPPDPDLAFGRVLAFRRNRYVALAREGCASVSWPASSQAQDTFEVNVWPKKFHVRTPPGSSAMCSLTRFFCFVFFVPPPQKGIYLLLNLHVMGERLVLDTLSTNAAAEADKVMVLGENQLFKMERLRARLRKLATEMVRYTLSLSSSECGGISEYSEFFRSLREVFGIADLRSELSEELGSVLSLVESGYLEEERRERLSEERGRRLRHEQTLRIERERDRAEAQVDSLLGLGAALVSPIVRPNSRRLTLVLRSCHSLFFRGFSA
jgi:hypothetical protein